MSNDNLPPGCTNTDTDGGVTREPTEEAACDYVRDHWELLLPDADAFGDVEIETVNNGNEQAEVMLTVRVPVYWSDIA